MAFKIIRNDITKVSADAIVNTANPFPVIGRGTDKTIYNAAGREKLLAARKKIGEIEPGKSAWTDSFNLKEKGIQYIIHTVGIYYNDGKNGETDILRSCYSSSLNMAKQLGCKRVAIPLLATGFYAFPKELGLQIAIDEISRFLIENEIDVTLVVYDRKSYLISEKLFNDIQSYIDDNFIESDTFEFSERMLNLEVEESCCNSFTAGVVIGAAPTKKAKRKEIAPIDVDAFITQSKDNLNFQNTLQQLIADRKLENIIIVFCTCVYFTYTVNNFSKRNSTPVIPDFYPAVLYFNINFIAKPNNKFVNRIFNYFLYKYINSVILI